MKMNRYIQWHKPLLLAVGVIISAQAFAQSMQVKGVITDDTNQAVIGATILVRYYEWYKSWVLMEILR